MRVRQQSTNGDGMIFFYGQRIMETRESSDEEGRSGKKRNEGRTPIRERIEGRNRPHDSVIAKECVFHT